MGRESGAASAAFEKIEVKGHAARRVVAGAAPETIRKSAGAVQGRGVRPAGAMVREGKNPPAFFRCFGVGGGGVFNPALSR